MFLEFARTHISPVAGDLVGQKEYPGKLWREMGRAGLLDPVRFGKVPGKWPDLGALALAGRELAFHGGNLGMGLSWLIHHLVGGYLVPRAFGRRQEGLLAEMAKGEKTVAFAVSEPKAGAHPKHIATRGEKDGDGFVLNGEKAYLSNGPIADAFLVIAVTGMAAGKKSFSAFLVPRDAPGLTVSGPMDLPFFNPSPHGGIKLENCRVGRDALADCGDRAWHELVMPFRGLEDRAMTGLVTGAVERLLKGAAELVQGREPGDVAMALGKLAVRAASARALMAQILNPGDNEAAPWQTDAVLIHFRELARAFVKDLETFLSSHGKALDGAEKFLLRDLKASAGLGKEIGRLRQIKIGRSLMGS